MIEAIKVNPHSLLREVDATVEKIEATIALLDEGLSIPFILRYRKDQTRLRDDVVVKIAVAYAKQRKFADRKYSYLKTLEERGLLTPELEKMIVETRSPRRLDDLYLPFKAKSSPDAQAARDKGLEPLAEAIMNAADEAKTPSELAAGYVDSEKGVATPEDALKGAADIIAERFSEAFELRQGVRSLILRTGNLVSRKAAAPVEEPTPEPKDAAPVETTPGVSEETEKSNDLNAETPAEPERAETSSIPEQTTGAEQSSEPAVAEGKKEKEESKKHDAARAQQLDRIYAPYYDASFDLRRISRDQIQTLNRGVVAEILDVSLQFDRAKASELAKSILLPEGRPYSKFLAPIVETALDRWLIPSLERETRRELVDGALEQALANVCSALYNKIMRRPIPGRRVLAVDCAYRNACKVAALDENGGLLETATVCIRGADERVAASIDALAQLIDKHNLTVLALRSGSGRIRNVDALFAKLVSERYADKDVVYIDVNDAGLDAYALSAAAKAEFPDRDEAERAAISLGRRLQNPLLEYVKVAPEYLCDDPFCRKLRGKALREALGKVVARAVNAVGVDVNTADAATLGYVVGLAPLAVENLIKRRTESGPFRSREQFKEISGVSDSTFAQCAGFMRVTDGDNPLDATWIHPESYPTAKAILEKFGFTVDDLRSPEKRAEFAEKTKGARVAELAAEFNVGSALCADVLAELANPGQDVREKQPFPVFKKGFVKLEDLKPGMELSGVVSRVVEYGAFIDFGAATPGMIHVSRLNHSRVRDAREVIAVGDAVKVWVVDVDVERGRVGLTLVEPGTDRDRRPRRDFDRREQREDRAGSGSERREQRPRRLRRDESGEGGSGRNERRGDRERSDDRRGRGSRRNDRDFRDRAPRSAEVAPKEKTIAPLSEDKKSGKESLQSFGELKQFFGL